MNDFLWNQMASVILEMKRPCVNGLERALTNEELYTGVRAANKSKKCSSQHVAAILLAAGQKDNYHQITQPSFHFDEMSSCWLLLFLSTMWTDNKLHFFDSLSP